MRLTTWIEERQYPEFRRSMQDYYDVPQAVVELLFADYDSLGGIYAATVVQRARAHGWGKEVEAALGVDEGERS